MNAATPDGEKSKNAGAFFSLFTLRDSTPRGGSESAGIFEDPGLPRRDSKNLLVLLAFHPVGIQRLGEAPEAGRSPELLIL